jgi:DNA polymerase-1
VSAEEVARFLLARPLVALTLIAGDDDLLRPASAALVVDEDGAQLHVDLEDARAAAALADCLADSDRVCVLDSARPQLRRLLRSGVDVARPACVSTLRHVLGEPVGDLERTARSDDAARERGAWALRELGGLIARSREQGQTRVARLENLVLRPFAALEDRGLPIDVARWRALVDAARARREGAAADVFAALGDAVGRDLFGQPDLSLDNDAEVKATFERVLGEELPDIGKGTLARLQHPLGDALLRYREGAKIVSTYGDAFLEHVHPRTGRIHATFFPLGASTGRVSSRDPNLQNLPSGEDFHRCIAPGAGRVVVTADYATCELRILAQLSGDERFAEAFANDEDLHSVVATRMFNENVSKEHNAELRKKAKAINFGLVYGMGAAALGRQVGASTQEAEGLLARYFQEFPRIRDYLEGSVDTALGRGYAQTLLGRRLHFDPEVLAADNARGELSRVAKNMPIQGTSADITKLAMVRVHERLRERFGDAGLINTIHDELVVECGAADGDAVAAAVEAEMGAAHSVLLPDVPPKVEVAVAPYWTH